MSCEPVLAFGRSISGVEFNSLDDRKAHLFFLILAPDSAVDAHLRRLARISRVLKDPAVRKGLLEAADAGSIHAIISEQERRFEYNKPPSGSPAGQGVWVDLSLFAGEWPFPSTLQLPDSETGLALPDIRNIHTCRYWAMEFPI
jgi:hypothetical protein